MDIHTVLKNGFPLYRTFFDLAPLWGVPLSGREDTGRTVDTLPVLDILTHLNARTFGTKTYRYYNTMLKTETVLVDGCFV